MPSPPLNTSTWGLPELQSPLSPLDVSLLNTPRKVSSPFCFSPSTSFDRKGSDIASSTVSIEPPKPRNSVTFDAPSPSSMVAVVDGNLAVPVQGRRRSQAVSLSVAPKVGPLQLVELLSEEEKQAIITKKPKLQEVLATVTQNTMPKRTTIMACGIEALLEDPLFCSQIHAYASKLHTEESIDFMVAVLDFREAPTTSKAQHIFDQFIETDSKQEINISGPVQEQTREDVKAVMYAASLQGLLPDEEVRKDLFDAAVGDLYPTLQNGLLPQFLQSRYWRVVLRGWATR